MVGIFSRFSGGRAGGHRRAQSAVDNRPSNSGTGGVGGGTTVNTHGIEVSVEFKPLEHPTEPMDNDQPILCPLPEPSILNDGSIGRIWKERFSQSLRRRADLPVMKEGEIPEANTSETKPKPTQASRTILPSLSAPEHNILNLLEDCNASGI